MINQVSILENIVLSLQIWLGIALFLIVILFIFIKVMWNQIEHNTIIVEKINNDNELKYENLVDVVCPSQIKLKKCDECTSTRQECWKEYFIERLNNRVPSSTNNNGKDCTFSIKEGTENANCKK
jgi:hypothetical protein